jgi:hypothetical protein
VSCKVEKLPVPERSGDWHDAPLKWKVVGPGAEVQKFSRKADAALYARIRGRRADMASAGRAYAVGEKP